jgi:hypothetical protein
MTSTCVRAAGPGGGHGGSGHGSSGHGGHGSGRSSTGHSSGHSIGHSIGNSFAHIFGHHGQGAGPATLPGAPPGHSKVSPSPESLPGLLDLQPKNRFIFRPPVACLPRRRAFGFGGCPYGWLEHDFRFGNNWNCSHEGLFFDPFFTGWFSGPLPYGPTFGMTWFKGGTAPDSTVPSPAEANPAYPPKTSDTIETTNSSGSPTPSPNDMKAERPITLLQLRDGSMYGLTDYWVKDGQLHYRTTYGGQNSLPFERIDFEKTVQLNAVRAVPFLLPPSSVPR